MFQSRLSSLSAADTVDPIPRSIELGLCTRTITPTAGGIEVSLASDANDIEDISRIRIHATHEPDAADRACLARAGIAALTSLPLSVTLPRALWHNLPGGQGPLRLRYRARIERDGDGLCVTAVATSLFPALP